ncbi:AAA domain protein [Ceratobasidium sp. AG-Ba]|nr:AAA domain protein [Ceratobasidium sp. AG-Ba]QRW09248.1 AAA domain protein [Ceratobasidium sp. AG-Ba]
MPVAEPSWRKKRTPCPFYKTGRCIFNEKCNFIHDGEIDYTQAAMRAAVPPYRRTPENSVDSFSSSEDEDDPPPRTRIDEHTAAAPSLIFSSIYGRHPNLRPNNHLQLSEVDLPVSPESLPESPGRVHRRPSGSSRASGILSVSVSSPTPSRPVSASLGIGIGGRSQGLAEVFTALATSQAHATALPPSSAGGSLPSPLSLSPQSPVHGAQDVVISDDNYTLEQFPFKLALSNQSSLLLNRTTRAAERENARRASSLPQDQAQASPSIKRPTNLSAPDRIDSVVLPPPANFSFERPASYIRSRSTSHHSDVPVDASEEEEEEYEEEEQEIFKETPPLEALLPYPRDVSIEPSPDPAQQGFGASTVVPNSVPEEDEEEPRRPPRRMDSDRKIDHERLLIELEERLNIDPSKRRARSATTTTKASQMSSSAPEKREERKEEAKVVVPKSGVDMEAARGMLGAMFAKRGMGEPLVVPPPEEEEEEFEEESQTIQQQGDDLDFSLGFGSSSGLGFGSVHSGSRSAAGSSLAGSVRSRSPSGVRSRSHSAGSGSHSPTRATPLLRSASMHSRSHPTRPRLPLRPASPPSRSQSPASPRLRSRSPPSVRSRSPPSSHSPRSMRSRSRSASLVPRSSASLWPRSHPASPRIPSRPTSVQLRSQSPASPMSHSHSPPPVRPRSPASARSGSPVGVQPPMPASAWSPSRSPASPRLRSQSLANVQSRSPTNVRSHSPASVRSRSPASSRSRSPDGSRTRSPAGLRSPSPVRMRSRSPAGLRSRSPTGLPSGSLTDLRLSVSSQSSAGQSLSFLPADWDIGSLDLDAHLLDLDSADPANGRGLNGFGSSSTPVEPEKTPRPPPELQDRQQTYDIRESGHYSEWRHAEEDVYNSERFESEHDGDQDEHLSHSDFSSDEEAEVQAVMESSVILRREVPRETSLPEAQSRMGSLKSIFEPEEARFSEGEESLDERVLDEDLTQVTNGSLASTVLEGELTDGALEEDSVHELPVGHDLPEDGWATAVPAKMVRAETVSASGLVFEIPRVESVPAVLDLPNPDLEQEAHDTKLGEPNGDMGERDVIFGEHASPDDDGALTLEDHNLDHHDLNAVTPIRSRSPGVQLPAATPLIVDLAVPDAPAPSPLSDASPTSLSSERQTDTEPSKRRSQLKPLRLSLLYGLKTPTTASITPISEHSPTPIASTFPVSSPQPEPYPTPATAHPSHPGSGTARSILSTTSPNPRPSLADVEDASEDVSVHGVGRGSFGPESVSWFGSKKGSTRGSLGESMRRSVARARSDEEASESSSRVIPPPLELTTPDDEDVRPLPVIWDDETDAESRPGSRTGSGDAGITASPSLSVPALDVSRDELTPTAESVSSLQRYPAFVNMEPTSPLPSPRFMGSARASPEPTSRPASRARKPSEPAEGPGSAPAESVRAIAPLREPEVVHESPPKDEPAPTLSQESAGEVEPQQKLESFQERHPELLEESQAAVRPNPPPRTRKWGDQSDDESIGSLPVFDAPVPPVQALAEEPPVQQDGRPAPRSNRPGYPRYYYPPLPDTAPLSISPRNVTPSMMQQEQEQGQDEEPRHKQIPWATPPLTAPLHLQMKMRAQQGEAASSPWMADYFVNSPSSLHSSQMGSMHSASSSVTTAEKIVGAEQNVVQTRQPTKIASLKAKPFGDPGPGPSTMITYSARKQSATVLGSPILLRSHSHAASLTNEPEPPVPKSRTPSRGTSRQNSIEQNEVTIVKPDVEPIVTVSSEEPVRVLDPSPQSASTRHPRLYSPLRNTVDGHYSPNSQSVRFKPLSSPNGRSPITPLPDHSPLNILRRNLATRPGSVSPGLLSPQTRLTTLSESRSSRHQHHGSLAAPTITRHEDLRNGPASAPLHQNRQSLTPAARFGGASPRPGSPTFSVQSAVSQTKPLLFFAIAKNSAQEVERLLQEGEVEPNDKAGPDDLPALAFTLANEQLTDKTQIVKSLLSHGADPSSVLDRKSGSGEFDDTELALSSRIEQGINPAIRYYLNRKRMTIPAPQAELLEKNNFGGLTRAGFSIIGQDAALDELIRVVAGHCRRQTLNPLVIVFSGGPGCGKSLLASKIGPLLHVPYFTVNMTNLRNESSLWHYISMTTKPGSPQVPLVDFLRVNEGQRCVVVLEEIEKAADKTVWHSLLMPWEWGKATVITPTTNEQIDIDTSKVIWIASSNSGDDATLKFFAERSRPSHVAPGESALTRLAHRPRENDQNFTRKDYLQLMQAVRKRLGELLGSSIISRVSSVLPFLPFTEDEVLALASESLSAMREAQNADQDLEDVDWDSLLQQAVGEYIPGEGARSVHRAVQRAFDEITEW